ncbi:hypothetical protein J1614_003918 [Plenodomus biglobosus]|nr:hypothetical protein J1614_003918 [Plenodomus biglobosus]
MAQSPARSVHDAAEKQRDAGRCIVPLPDDVVAQIKSSTAIVSLSSVVLELVNNSLDAQATRIEAAVDFARGGCTVEDDGVGIPPAEFREEGGLGKLYCTSKYTANETQLGRHGTFLASLAAMSLLTITSHHQEYRSHNSITFHLSKAVERQLPSPANKHVHSKHGTRVTVRNLFGNLPVRVKQRSAVLEHKAEQDRLWDALKRDMVALLLSWHGPISVKVRDGDGRPMINLNTLNSPDPTSGDSRHDNRQLSVRLTSLLNVLTQANYIQVNEWPSWVPVSASTSTVSIKGAISLNPAPSKHVQFLSLGIRPLLSEHGNNELYDEINRLFSLSSFGAVEDDLELDDFEKTRRRADKRFKSDGYTNRQLKTRKDVDRHPMFHLRIMMKDRSSGFGIDQLGSHESLLQNVLEVLGAMVTQWLSAHHFRPQHRRRKRGKPDTASSTVSSTIENDTPLAVRPLSTLLQPRTDRPQTAEPGSRPNKKARLKQPSPRVMSERIGSQVFADWSRIKSGKAGFFEKAPGAFLNTKASFASPGSPVGADAPQSSLTAAERFANLDVEPIQQGALSMEENTADCKNTTAEVQTLQKTQDDAILWTDPVTKKTYLLNARTGCVVPDLQSRPNTASASIRPVLTQKTMNKSLRLPQRPATASVVETPWLTNVLQNWENPVFNTSERRIQQVGLHELERDNGHYQAKDACSRMDIERAFDQVTADTKSGKLSKRGLQHAEVISQVDKKFILVKMKSSPDTVAQDAKSTDLLVLIDQHAADERIQVEHLLRELCTPITNQSAPAGSYQSKLGHAAHVRCTHLAKPLQYTISQTERTHFTTHAPRFAAWGILFDILDTASPAHRLGSKDQHHQTQTLLAVTTLPPAISERCKADPKILISLLRSTVWKYVEDGQLPSFAAPSTSVKTATSTSTSTSPSPSNTPPPPQWIQKLATCPPALVDLINSRACRSAIMFNDELSREQCRDLVARLAQCVFPFMCAHGRPSMVPLGGVGGIWGAFGGDEGNGDWLDDGSNGTGGGEERGFLQAWREWR